MPIPDYQTFMLPVLKLAADGEVHRSRDAYDAMAELFDITDRERQEMLPSGSQPLLNNRVGWAITYLRQAGLLESTKRGWFRITQAGRDLLAEQPTVVNANTLERYPAFLGFKYRTRSAGGPSSPAPTDQYESAVAEEGVTPEEALAAAWRQHRRQLEEDVLEQVLTASPAFFERLVLDLLVAMGYGGSRTDAAQCVGRSGDGGIDGTINEDPLGLDVIYLQAKRWQGSVGRPEIQKFVGALQGQRSRKGVFITTSTFTNDARDYVRAIESRIILIDGSMLGRLMVEHGVGV